MITTADQQHSPAGPHKLPKRSAAQQRTCAVSRQAHDPEDLIRFAAAPDGTIVPDLHRKLPGRGVWLQAKSEVVEKAIKKNVFARSLKEPVKPGPGLAQLVERLLFDDARQSLAMAKKAGALVVGAFQVEKLLARGSVAAVIQASDGSQDGIRKIDQALFRQFGAGADQVARVKIFDSSQLGLALGQTNVIHAALRQGAATQAFLSRVRRLAQYRENRTEPQTAKVRHSDDTRGAEIEDK